MLEIAETFIPLQHAFTVHEAESRFSRCDVTSYEIFEEFWDEEGFQLLVKNTNEYAALRRRPDPPPGVSQVRVRSLHVKQKRQLQFMQLNTIKACLHLPEKIID